MTDQKREQNIVVGLLLFWAIVLGGVVRLTPALQGSHPVMDGGLFYTMAQDLQDANFRLPYTTSYNAAHIPFIYPPLPFYVAAILNILGLPMLEIFRWLPPILSTLSIPLFYLLSRHFLKTHLQRGLATVAFAMLPTTYDLFIMGGGMTRGFGAIFSLLTLWTTTTLFKERKRLCVLSTALSASLLVLSHPEITFHTLFVVGLLWLCLGRDVESALLALAVAVGVLALTSPWWLSIIRMHGLKPVLATLGTGWHNWLFWAPLIRLDFAGETYLGIITVFGILGVLACLLKKSYHLPAWLILPFITEPRNPFFTAMVPLAMLTGIGLSEVVLPGLKALEQHMPKRAQEAQQQTTMAQSSPLASRGFRLLLSFFLIYPLINAYAASLNLAKLRVSDRELAAMQWITTNTPEDARFILMTYGDPFNIPAQEWFPTLTERVSLTTVQGYEWLAGQLYGRKQAFVDLQTCLFEDLSCVEHWAEQHNHSFDYVYVDRGVVGNSDTTKPEDNRLAALLIQSLQTSPDYKPVYDTPDIKIYQHLNAGDHTANKEDQ